MGSENKRPDGDAQKRPGADAEGRPGPESVGAEGERAERASAKGAPRPDEPSLPEIDFSTFIISLSTSAMYHLGAIQDPGATAREPNLPLAKQTVDILGMLRDKTEGNRTAEETRLIDTLLYDLRMRYVNALNKKTS